MTMRAAPSLQLSSENLPTEITPPPNMPDCKINSKIVTICGTFHWTEMSAQK